MLGTFGAEEEVDWRLLGCHRDVRPVVFSLCFETLIQSIGGGGPGRQRYAAEVFVPPDFFADDLIFEIIREPVVHRRLAVELALSRDSVGPVLDREFDAVAQDWDDPTTGERTDTIGFEISVHWEPSGPPVAGTEVKLRVEPVDSSGGHPHPGRPPGTFFHLGENVQEKEFTRDTLTLILSAEGTAEGVYRTSGVSGIERVIARVAVENTLIEDTARVTIRLPADALEEVERSGTGYVFEGEVNSHYPHENYLAPGVIDVMEAIWGDYIKAHQGDPERYPMTGSRFTVTGASAIWGGLYDIRSDWASPHSTHRLGKDVDFDDGGAEQRRIA